MSDPAPRIVLLEGHRKRAFYANVMAALDADFHEASPAELLEGPAHGVDLVLVDDETWPYTAAAICACRRAGVPTLHLVDGIVEWKNTWENPRQATENDGMPLFQPVLSDKIACMGRSQARLIESWGNPGKCEVTGSPRFDGIVPLPLRDGPDEAVRVLVVTARTPAFKPDHRRSVESSLRDLRGWFDAGPTSRGRPVQPVWRLTDGLDEALGIDNNHRISLVEQLEHVDAVITTPSTVQVEAMLSGRPVALLDYLNLPHFVPAAWTISAPEHIATIVPQIAAPEATRMQYQQTILADTVEAHGSSARRVADLAERMISLGRACRASGQPLQLPARVLAWSDDSAEGEEPRFRPELLHPRHPIFRENDVSVLQTEVAQLRRVIRISPWHRLYRFATEAQRRLGFGKPRS